jgi:hypothetical protein
VGACRSCDPVRPYFVFVFLRRRLHAYDGAVLAFGRAICIQFVRSLWPTASHELAA